MHIREGVHGTLPPLRFLLLTFAFLAAFASSPRIAWGFTPPLLEGHVTDLTRTLDENQKRTLDGQMANLDQASTVEIAVLILGSLNGEAIEDVGYATANAWKLGKGGKDNGVLLVIATGDRRVRIEVGKGLEGQLTDLQANDIIHQKINPELKQGKLFEGVEAGVMAIASAAAGHYVVTGAASPMHSSGSVPLPITILGVILIVFVIWVLRRMGGGGYWGGGGGFGGGGGGFGGGGGDGGGFSGGGGSFGGGGSSDSY
jgi:uncharacterized protein